MSPAGWTGLGTRMRLELYDSGQHAQACIEDAPVRVTGAWGSDHTCQIPAVPFQELEEYILVITSIQVHEVVQQALAHDTQARHCTGHRVMLCSVLARYLDI